MPITFMCAPQQFVYTYLFTYLTSCVRSANSNYLNYCPLHVTLPRHILHCFANRFSNCNYSLNSWRISLNFELCTYLYVIFMTDTYYCSILISCFGVAGVILGGQTALVNTKHHRMAWYLVCNSSDTPSRCTKKNYVILSKTHWIKAVTFSKIIIFKLCPKLNPTVVILWDIDKITQFFLCT